MRTICFTMTVITGFMLCFWACTESASSTRAGFFAMPQTAKKPEIDPVLQSFIDGYDRYFMDSMRMAGPPGGAVAIVKDNQIVFLKGYGEKVAGSHDPVDEHTVFRIASLSKGFASVLTGLMVEKGLLRWDDPVQQHYPSFSLKDKQQAQRVQIRHLLSHTTGLPYQAYSNLIEEGFDLETIIRQYFPAAKLAGKEGTFFGYQNTGYCVIELVLLSVTGQHYQELLRDNIFHPAGMLSASCDYESMQRALNKALPHTQTETGWSVDSIAPAYYRYAAAGGVNASIADMGQWLLVLLGQTPQVVSNNVLEEVFHPVIKTGSERRILPGWIGRDSTSYALGWRVLEHGADTLLYHSGYVNNYHCEIAFNRKEKIGVCVLFNGYSTMKGACIKEFFERWNANRMPAMADSLPAVQ